MRSAHYKVTRDLMHSALGGFASELPTQKEEKAARAAQGLISDGCVTAGAVS